MPRALDPLHQAGAGPRASLGGASRPVWNFWRELAPRAFTGGSPSWRVLRPGVQRPRCPTPACLASVRSPAAPADPEPGTSLLRHAAPRCATPSLPRYLWPTRPSCGQYNVCVAKKWLSCGPQDQVLFEWTHCFVLGSFSVGHDHAHRGHPTTPKWYPHPSSSLLPTRRAWFLPQKAWGPQSEPPTSAPCQGLHPCQPSIPPSHPRLAPAPAPEGVFPV